MERESGLCRLVWGWKKGGKVRRGTEVAEMSYPDHDMTKNSVYRKATFSGKDRRRIYHKTLVFWLRLSQWPSVFDPDI